MSSRDDYPNLAAICTGDKRLYKNERLQLADALNEIDHLRDSLVLALLKS